MGELVNFEGGPGAEEDPVTAAFEKLQHFGIKEQQLAKGLKSLSPKLKEMLGTVAPQVVEVEVEGAAKSRMLAIPTESLDVEQIATVVDKLNTEALAFGELEGFAAHAVVDSDTKAIVLSMQGGDYVANAESLQAQLANEEAA